MKHLCNADGGRAIGAGHSCLCVRTGGHPTTDERPHGCLCGAMWGCEDCEHADPTDGCAGCGAFPRGAGVSS